VPALAAYLSGMLGKSVVDETGLKGVFDFKLEWIREVADSGGTAANSLDWIFSALPQQLGLRLDARKAPAEMLVIDGIEKPSAN